jgi:putative tricarboxylic transport membrane protein
MSLFDAMRLGFSVALTPVNLLLALAGALLGTLVGALPGIGSTSAVALLLPLTFNMDPTGAIILLCGIYYGSMYGGTITSVLINTPGESATVVTALDGYQLARQGRAGAALGIATIASFFAGTMGTAALMVTAPTLARFALSFGPPEYFALTVLGLSMLTGLTSGSPSKAVLSALLGLIVATVGLDVTTGMPRLTFGSIDLLGGIDFLPVSIALFGLTEILVGAEDAAQAARARAKVAIRDVFPNREDLRICRPAILRGTLAGFAIGTLPGAGATLASFMAYALEKRSSRRPERFGQGAIEGVAAPEAANNAASAGALVPLLTLGLPGGTTTAVLVGALIMWGIRPGPLLFQENPQIAWGLIASMYIGNVMLLLLNIVLIPVFVRALLVPYSVLAPSVVVLCLVGAYAANNRMWDVGVMLVFSAVGLAMRKLGYSPAAFVAALVLGPLCENAFRQSLQISQGSFAIFATRPIAAVLLGVAVAALAAPALRYRGGGGSGGIVHGGAPRW